MKPPRAGPWAEAVDLDAHSIRVGRRDGLNRRRFIEYQRLAKLDVEELAWSTDRGVAGSARDLEIRDRGDDDGVEQPTPPPPVDPYAG